jgi:hypothetical protein
MTFITDHARRLCADWAPPVLELMCVGGNVSFLVAGLEPVRLSAVLNSVARGARVITIGGAAFRANWRAPWAPMSYSTRATIQQLRSCATSLEVSTPQSSAQRCPPRSD